MKTTSCLQVTILARALIVLILVSTFLTASKSTTESVGISTMSKIAISKSGPMDLTPIHDVAIKDVAVSKTVVGQGCGLNVSVFAKNEGDYTETLNVTTRAELVEAGLVGYWKFDEGSGVTAYDSSGNDNHGALMNGSTYVDGRVEKALSFDGVDDYVEIADSDLWHFGENDFSIAYWVYFNSLMSNKHQLIGQSNGGGIQDKWFIAYNFSGNPDVLTFDVCRTGETETDISFQWTPSTNRWYYLTVVRSGTSWCLYINGIQEGPAQSNSIGIPNVASTLKIGSDGELWNFHDGMIDEVRIYDRSLSATEIHDKYTDVASLVGYWKFDENSGSSANDSSGNGNTGILINEPTWVDGRIGNALEFDGVNDSVQIPDSPVLDITTEISVSAWVKVLGDGTRNGVVVCKQGTAGSLIASYSLDVYPSIHTPVGRHVEFALNIDGGWTPFVSTSALNINTWNLIAGTYNGSTVRIFINGALDANYTLDGTIVPTNGPLYIGHEDAWPPLPGEYFNGTIDEVRIYDAALSAEEIRTEYAMRSTPISMQTVALASGGSTVLTLTWNTSGFVRGNYTVISVVDMILGEIHATDNSHSSPQILVTIPGDVNGDSKVNIIDIVVVAIAFNSRPEDPNWSVIADITNNGFVNILDIVFVAIHFGETG